MAVFKCKMCGGTIEFEKGATIGVCDSCGTKQTLPRLDNDKRTQLFERANEYRRANEYDKAMGIYEIVLSEAQDDAEAYWSLVLCQYGIEYVEDPMSHKRIPTVNRAQFTSIFDDTNYHKALEYADFQQKEIYEDEAKTIDEIQKNILEISSKEEPFDVFICYKETDENGCRTQDSVQAMELYKALEKENFKVFFSRVTLEEKLGTAFEPYIFAALNSAKVMVAIGSKPEYFNAVWVKNEWSRYVSLVKQDNSRTLIPAYFGMDPKYLPNEFSNLQAQDLSKVGAIQDIVHGIEKLLGKNSVGKNTIETNSAVQGLLESVYSEALEKMNVAKTGEDFIAVSREFAKILGYKDTQALYDECLNKAKECKEKSAKKRKLVGFAIVLTILCACIVFLIFLPTIIKNSKYNAAIKLMNDGKFKEAIVAFETMNGYKDSVEKIAEIKLAIFKNAEIGDIVYFGTYEQDNNISNGKEAVAWLVIEKENNKILVISDNALDCQQFNNIYTDITWESSSLRKWLNGTFLNTTFSLEEQAQIQNTIVSADKNPQYNTNSGKRTNDKVFLLSIAEAKKYFATDESRKCVPTAYAKAQCAYTDDSNSSDHTSRWWLRSPGSNSNYAAGVGSDGFVWYGGDYVNSGHNCVRPAIWINLE